MKKYFLIAVFSALCSFPSAQTHINITAAQWQEDIRYFKEQMVKKHMNAFHHVSKEEYEKDMEQLYNDAPSLKDNGEYGLPLYLFPQTTQIEYTQISQII